MADENKQRFMVRCWEDIRKGGGVSLPIDTIVDYLKGDDNVALSRQDILDRVAEYFSSCMKLVQNEETGEVENIWKRNPTKTGLALALGISKETLLYAVKGVGSNGKPYREDAYSHRKIQNADFDIIRRAYSVIEGFYEEKLAENRNAAGLIYWLNNSNNTRWSNEQEITFNKPEQHYLTADELPRCLPTLDENPSSSDKDSCTDSIEALPRLPFDDGDDTFL